MNEREIIKAKLEQNDADQRKLREEHARLESEMICSGVTYSIGDRFKYYDGDKILLASVCGSAVLIGLKSGNYFAPAQDYEGSMQKITVTQFSRIANSQPQNYTRYWDSQKKVLLNKDGTERNEK